MTLWRFPIIRFSATHARAGLMISEVLAWIVGRNLVYMNTTCLVLQNPADVINDDSLTVQDEPMPEPQPGEVPIKIRAVSLNYRAPRARRAALVERAP